MNVERKEELKHPIRVVSRRTGLTPALLRAWEKRYGVVAPSRTDGGQRQYSDDDVHRLALLHRVVEEGRSIRQVADLSMSELERLVEEDQAERRAPPRAEPLDTLSVAGILEQAERSVDEMDAIHLEQVLTRGAMALSVGILIDDVVLPLLERIGGSWRERRLGPAQEHLASRVIRRFLDWLLSTVSVGDEAPVLLAATPAGESHEFGALLSAVFAATEGWQGVFIGPDLPASEIAAAALRLKARAVALSVVDPMMTDALPEEVRDLRERLPAAVRIIVGGPREITAGLSRTVEGVEVMAAMGELRRTLREEVLGW